ncbi:uncharacterized protein LOC111708280 [Eurytemora carolleeae]|uniref:uncharacterized protein LOC111708280 n=1 Tax=Eurytemora carolleeae TaxID=1294199 RepID=UPI000C78677F|nr:uncharacterized protein LOC111708280 [Eurytemora carolleeae]|eukprot:XP_023337369.1 uncharacterized protein LOC111708280 [Eurytemora affinis]
MFSKVSEFLWKIFLIISLFNFTNGVDSEPHDTHGKDSEPLFTPEKDSESHYTPEKDSEPHFTPEKDSEPHSEDINHNPSKFHSILYKELPFTKEKGNHTNSEMLENPFGCECGAGDYGETVDSDISLHQEYSFPPITNRIVNGYDAKQKPWMLFLHIKSRFDESVSTSCGATILNPRWAITAAHCLCSPSDLRAGLICERKDGVTKAMYKPYDPNLGFDMFIYFGTSAIHFILNGDERDVRKFRLSLKKVLIHPGFLLSSKDMSDVGADVALIQTRRSIPFSESVSPICLPGPTFRDEEVDAFIVGYGRTSDAFCMTTGEGPDPFKQCRSLALVSVPYKYENGYQPEPFSGCSFLPTPQSFNPRCSLSMIETALNQNGMSWEQDVTRNGFVTLEYNGVNSTCYRNTPSLENHGWCGVCDTVRYFDKKNRNKV